MRKVSIKTVDGGRFDYTRPDNEGYLTETKDGEWISVTDRETATIRLFLKANVVSVTVKAIED